MRILVDGVVFAEPTATESSGWWRAVLPYLLADLAEDEVVFLRRAAVSESVAPVTHHLWAPAAERSAAREDRRLTALCREVGAGCFVSTFGTSAGADVATVVVLPASRPRRWLLDDRTALRLGSRFITFSPGLDRRLVRLGITPDEIVRWPGAGPSSSSDPGAAAAQARLIAETLRQVPLLSPDPGVEVRRRAAAAAFEHEAGVAASRSLQRMLKAYRRDGQRPWVRAQVARVVRALRHPARVGRRMMGRSVEERTP